MKEANKFFNKLSASPSRAKIGTVVRSKGTVNRISIYDVELSDGSMLLNVPSGVSSLTSSSLVVVIEVDTNIDNILFNARGGSASSVGNTSNSVIIARLRS